MYICARVHAHTQRHWGAGEGGKERRRRRRRRKGGEEGKRGGREGVSYRRLMSCLRTPAPAEGVTIQFIKEVAFSENWR